MNFETTHINKNITLLNQTEERGEYFKKTTYDLSEGKVKIYKWFDPSNGYPQRVINEIRNGTTLGSIFFEDLIYKTGSGFSSTDKSFENFINKEKINSDDNFKSLFKKTNDSFNKLGNSFNEIILDEKLNLLSIDFIQPQKCRITLKDTVLIYSDWSKFNKEKATELPIYPKLKKFKRKGVVFYKSIQHIKNEVLGFDHYGINDKMFEALLLNEKEHRRNNWQLNQIKKGFKRDFLFVTDFAQTLKEKENADEAFAKISGDENAGGVANIEGENGKLVPVQSNYNFDFTKDDTSDQLFLKMGFPKSLIGIKSGSAFSVEQVESDYDQYLPKVEEQQNFLISMFKTIFNNHTNFNTADWVVINKPPSIVLQRYMQFMNDAQRNKVIDNVLAKYGI